MFHATFGLSGYFISIFILGWNNKICLIDVIYLVALLLAKKKKISITSEYCQMNTNRKLIKDIQLHTIAKGNDFLWK